MSVITLLTDFGLRDGYVGVMKGVIWGIAPEADIADITHLIQPQDILEGALALGRTASFFPHGTIHVGVVDPGVGGRRRPIAARLGDQYFVGPDNGLCSVLLEQAREGQGEVAFVHLDRPEFWLKEISNVFHGRDIFAPVAAHLAKGIPLSELGSRIDDPVLLQIPHPERTAGGWRGAVMHVDSFGNLSTNLGLEQLSQTGKVEVRIGQTTIRELKAAFSDSTPGELVALIDSSGKLCLSVVNGNAAERLGVQVGDTLEVKLG